MTKYPVGENITYTAVAKTDGYSAVDHAYHWSFDDSTSSDLSSVVKAWSTAGSHVATVVATNSITNGTASESKTVEVRDLSAWVSGSDPTPNRSWRVVAYGNNIFMAASIGSDSKTVFFATSSDGETWDDVGSLLPSSSLLTLSIKLSSIGSRFVCLAFGNTSDPSFKKIWYSDDNGASWAECVYPNRRYIGLDRVGDKLIVVAGTADSGGATNQFAYSDDGITFTGVTSPENRDWYASTYGNGTYIVVSGGGPDAVAVSSDLVTWTRKNLPLNITWDGCSFNGTTFVAKAVSWSFTSSRQFAFSNDNGATWTSCANTGSDAGFTAIDSYDGIFVAVRDGFANQDIGMFSYDGNVWYTINQVIDGRWNAVANNGLRFVSVCSNPSTSGAVSQFLEW